MTSTSTPAARAPRADSTPSLPAATAARLAAQDERVAALAAFRAYAQTRTFAAEQGADVVPFTRVDVEWMISFAPTTAAANYRALVAAGSVTLASEGVTITAV